MDRVLSPPLVSAPDWEPKLKDYPHFDHPISLDDIYALVEDPARVANNTFYPFLLYNDSWQPFRNKKEGKPERKSRPIRYASRRDSYIFAYYRHLLSPLYERELVRLDISDCVSAYRKIRQPSGKGKSNIEFADEAFSLIAKYGESSVAALDISSFFESLDHGQLLDKWKRLLGVSQLPPDHEAVFRAITRYAVVDRDEAYRRLGYLKTDPATGVERQSGSIPRKLCSNAEFREQICGAGGKCKSLVDNNRKPFGIPQGSPISDLLANMYMLDFDAAMHDYCSKRGGAYRRYSDDILLIFPGAAHVALDAFRYAQSQIKVAGERLLIKDRKTAVLRYFPNPSGAGQSFEHVFGEQGKNGLEYLGFRFDGKEIWLRDATLSRLYRKVSGSIYSSVHKLAARFPGKDAAFLNDAFDYSEFFQRYGRIDEFEPSDGYEAWTFWTYARKAAAVFGLRGRPIPMQLRRYRKIVRTRVKKLIAEIT